MAGMRFRQYQLDAIMKMHNGCILCGGVGSGKSFTALGYYYLLSGGDIYADEYKAMIDSPPMDLYIITTARKRDTHEWDRELIPFLLSTDPKCNYYKNKVVIDSWNNIKKYTEVKDAFFIFDEQRVVGNGQVLPQNHKEQFLDPSLCDTWRYMERLHPRLHRKRILSKSIRLQSTAYRLREILHLPKDRPLH